ncbi:MAG: polysaccharide biosynthesis C-terminal domain-containing protein, partial [Lachnospiraceae bacterium]|nr:polysaccharide biosynthesis C-terminal domain-containing protein [Lachnospiraceae bacterium]
KQVLMPIGRQTKYNISVIVGAIFNILLYLFLIPHLYSIGAAISSVASETIILFMFLYYSRDYIELSWIVKSSLKYLCSGCLMFVMIKMSYHWFSESWPSLILQIFGGIVVYFVCLIIIRDGFLIDALKSIIGKLRNKFKS